MAKSTLPILLTSAGVVAAGVIGYTVISNQDQFVGSTSPNTNIVQSNQGDARKAEAGKKIELSKLEPAVEEAKNAPSPVKEELKPSIPVFSVLRVEPDGNAVVAGTGPGNSKILLFDGSLVISETKSGPEGDFAFVLDKPLSPGSHELSMLAVLPSGTEIESEEAGLIQVPEPDKENELAVLVTKPGAASRIIVKPEAEATKAAKKKTIKLSSLLAPKTSTKKPVETPEEVKKVAPKPAKVNKPAEIVVRSAEEDNADIANQLEIKADSDTEVLSVTVKVVDPLQRKKKKKVAPVMLEAADIEGDKLFIAGTGEPGSTVRIYLGAKHVGETEVADNGAFLFEGDHPVAAGRHKVRADMIAANNGEVLARAEVDLIHEPEPQKQQIASVEKTEDEGVEEQQSVVSNTPKDNSNETPVAKETDAAEAKPEEEPVEEKASEPSLSDVEPNTVTATASSTLELSTPDAEAKQTKEIKTGAAVIIRRGDNLWRVARRNYGAGIRYTTIFEANRDQVRDPHLIYPGQVLKVPEEQQNDTESSDG